jgi:hypothetical protein
MFDVGARLDGLRCRETEAVRARRAYAIRMQRRWHLEELACTAVLDERRAVDEKTIVRQGVSVRSARDRLETARRLEVLPWVAAAAAEGRLSDEQLTLVVQLAEEATDAEWAARAPAMPVAELARRVRTRAKPSTADGHARREARHLRMWWSDDHTMLHLRGALADVDGATFESTIQTLADRIRPGKGQAWDRWEHRAADALVQLCDHTARGDADAEAGPLVRRPLFVVEVPLSGPATVAGVPIPDTLVEQWRASADLEATLVDRNGRVVKVGRRASALSPKVVRAVLLRDQACRICGTRHGLHAHHLRPRSWGGTDDPANLAMVCARGPQACHSRLIPNGSWALVGDPTQPGSLRMVHLDELTETEADHIGVPHELRPNTRRRPDPARAGPQAA